MRIVIDEFMEGKVVRVDVGRRLDLRAHKTFSEATICAVENPRTVAIVVDFSDTHQLFDSGTATLFDLMMRARYLDIPLRLINARPEIRLKLSVLARISHQDHGSRIRVGKHRSGAKSVATATV